MTDMAERERRRVQVQTRKETMEGWLNVCSTLRTLDDLNLVSPRFLALEVDTPASMSFEPGRIGLDTNSILFVRELTEYRRPGNRVEAAQFSRAPVRLLLGDFEVQGFMHVPGRGDPLTRLSQTKHRFVALTSVSVVGPGYEFASSFLAVNRTNIDIVQTIVTEADPASTQPATVEIG